MSGRLGGVEFVLPGGSSWLEADPPKGRLRRQVLFDCYQFPQSIREQELCDVTVTGLWARVD